LLDRLLLWLGLRLLPDFNHNFFPAVSHNIFPHIPIDTVLLDPILPPPEGISQIPPILINFNSEVVAEPFRYWFEFEHWFANLVLFIFEDVPFKSKDIIDAIFKCALNGIAFTVFAYITAPFFVVLAVDRAALAGVL
jgi:hypothetical protein